MLIQELHRIQQKHGYLPERELRNLSEWTDTSLYHLEEVSSFYPHFRRQPPPLVEIKVCRDMSCHLQQSADLLDEVQGRFSHLADRKTTETSPRQLVKVCGVSCLGRCDRAPAAVINESLYLCKFADQLCQAAGHLLVENLQAAKQENLIEDPSLELTRVAGSAPPPDRDADLPLDTSTWEIDYYQGEPTYLAVCKFVETLEDETGQATEAERNRVLDALEVAGLRGMGGAGARTFKKWGEVRQAIEKLRQNTPETEVAAYVVCNGDESEPGTFKDRELLLRTPYLVLEGVILAGLLLKAKAGYIYIRHEYKEQIQAVREEIKRAESQQFCGEDVLGTGISFPVEVVESPGGYICGEQTALIEALEGKRAEPRNRPPALQENGLWDKPTLLNNVETLAWVPAIVLQDEGQWYANLAPGDRFRGKRFFSISGDVNKPGVYEVVNGIKLRELIRLAGGDCDGVKAVALSGPSGGFLPSQLPRGFIEDRLSGIQKQVEPSRDLVKQSAEALAEELNRLNQCTPHTPYADEASSSEEFRRRMVDQATPVVRTLQDRLYAFAGDFDPISKSLRWLDELLRQWDKEKAALPSTEASGRPITAGDRLEELVKICARRTVALGNRCTGIVKSLGRLETQLKDMFPNNAPTLDVLEFDLDKQHSYGVGFMLGAGIVIYGQHRDMVAEARNCLEFFRNESCGQCVPCRIGSQKLVEIAAQLDQCQLDRATWQGGVSDLVRQLSSTMENTSICGLGEVAANPLTTLIAYFPREIEKHLSGPTAQT